MDRVKQFHRVFRLVGLQLPDQMQRDIFKFIAKHRPFCRRLLHPVFTEQPVTHRQQGPNLIGGTGFGDSNECHILRLSLRQLSRLGYFFLNRA